METFWWNYPRGWGRYLRRPWVLPPFFSLWNEINLSRYRKNLRCKIFLGYTSNMISAGTREIIKYLCQHQMVLTTRIDVYFSPLGGCCRDHVWRDRRGLYQMWLQVACRKIWFRWKDFKAGGYLILTILRSFSGLGQNRIGNLMVTNEGYEWFEDWLLPILDQMLVVTYISSRWTCNLIW